MAHILNILFETLCNFSDNLVRLLSNMWLTVNKKLSVLTFFDHAVCLSTKFYLNWTGNV